MSDLLGGVGSCSLKLNKPVAFDASLFQLKSRGVRRSFEGLLAGDSSLFPLRFSGQRLSTVSGAVKASNSVFLTHCEASGGVR